jgi:hypothetical protein
MRLTESLQLDDKTAATFIPTLTALEQSQRKCVQENHRMMRELRQELSSKNHDPGKLASILEKMQQNHREIAKLRERMFDAAKDGLSVEQQARYLLFQHDFMREMRGMISSARGGNGPARNMRSGPAEPSDE